MLILCLCYKSGTCKFALLNYSRGRNMIIPDERSAHVLLSPEGLTKRMSFLCVSLKKNCFLSLSNFFANPRYNLLKISRNNLCLFTCKPCMGSLYNK
jgi:hypothetical protein